MLSQKLTSPDVALTGTEDGVDVTSTSRPSPSATSPSISKDVLVGLVVAAATNGDELGKSLKLSSPSLSPTMI